MQAEKNSLVTANKNQLTEISRLSQEVDRGRHTQSELQAANQTIREHQATIKRLEVRDDAYTTCRWSM